MGVEETKIMESIEILQKKGLIKKTGLNLENKETYSLKRGFKMINIAFPSLILLHIILTIITMIYILTSGGSVYSRFSIRFF